MLQGRFIQTWIDNMAALFAIQTENSADPRFQLLILLQDTICNYYSLDLSAEFVRSKDNTLADPASRGDLKRLSEQIRVEGFNSVHQLDFLKHQPSDLDELLDALVQATRSMKSKTKSNDFNP